MTRLPLFLGSLFWLLILQPVSAATNSPTPASAVPRPVSLPELLDRAVKKTLDEFAPQKLLSNQLAVTLINLRDRQRPEQASYRGGEQVYPASVVKLFYLAATHRWLEDGRLKESPELTRAARDMIVDSLNEATGYIVDCLTDTTSGPELAPDALEAWYQKRNAVNRYFSSLGYTHINVNRKPWCEGPYGREQQSVQAHKPNHRNWLTTDATARLLSEIALGKAVSAARSQEMMALLKRDPSPKTGEPGDQAHAFTGLALPNGARLWSKAGWTSQTRHDAAYIELPDGARFVLVIFTVDHAGERGIIPAVARTIIEGLSARQPEKD